MAMFDMVDGVGVGFQMNSSIGPAWTMALTDPTIEKKPVVLNGVEIIWAVFNSDHIDQIHIYYNSSGSDIIVTDIFYSKDKFILLELRDINIVTNLNEISNGSWLSKVNAGDDTFRGNDHSDVIVGGLGRDEIFSSGGNDILSGGDGTDILSADDGNDSLQGDDGDDGLFGGGGNDSLQGGGGDDDLFGGGENDVLQGNTGDDALAAGDGNDYLFGGDGQDKLLGGLGRDVLRGNAGGDKFIFAKLSDSLKGMANRDVIAGLQHGTDLIKLSDIDANSKVQGNQKFDWIGNDAFSGTAGELRYGRGLVQADVNGDAKVDFEIKIMGGKPTEGDFFL